MGNGNVYEVGVEGGDGFVARAGLIPGTTVTTLPTSGSATMTGTYESARVTSIDLTGSRLTGSARRASGSLTLEADFANNTSTGNQLLTVDGSFEDENLTGTVVYNNIRCTLSGKVGGSEAVGVFHGKTDTSLMAGGFIVEE